jgi:putative methyltransferase (TIGR04325 family)
MTSKNQENKDFYIWEGIYSSFKDAYKDAVGPGFSGEIYQERALSVVNECLTALDLKEPIPNFRNQSLRSNYLQIIIAMMIHKKSDKRNVRILEFGGGLGIDYVVLKESISDSMNLIDYTIVENQEICSIGNSLFEKEEVKYIEELPLLKTYDIVYASSAIQYIDNWKGLLSKFSDFNPEYILLSDVFAGPIDQFVTFQNYYGSQIPHWFLNFEDLATHCAEMNYEIIMKTYHTSRRLDQEDVLPMDNFPKNLRLARTLNLLLKRKV